MPKKSIYSIFVNKTVWLMYQDGDKTETLVGNIIAVDNDGVVIETFQNNTIIPIKSIIKLKERKNGDSHD